MVEIVETAPQVLAWQLPHDQDGLPEELRLALADPHGPAVVVLTDSHPAIWFQEALALGVDDVIVLPQPPQRWAWPPPRPGDAQPPRRRRDRAGRREGLPRRPHRDACSRPRAAPARP